MKTKQHTGPKQPLGKKKKKIKREFKNYLKTKGNGNNILKLMGCNKSSTKRKVYSNKCLNWKKNSNILNFIPQETNKKRKKLCRREEVIKNWAEINQTEEKRIKQNQELLFKKINKIHKLLARLRKIYTKLK